MVRTWNQWWIGYDLEANDDVCTEFGKEKQELLSGKFMCFAIRRENMLIAPRRVDR